MFSFVCRSRSGRRLSPVMMDGKEKPGISARERILLLLSRRLQGNLEQNYDARYNDLVRDKLCGLQRHGVKLRKVGRIRNWMVGLGSKGLDFYA